MGIWVIWNYLLGILLGGGFIEDSSQERQAGTFGNRSVLIQLRGITTLVKGDYLCNFPYMRNAT